MKTTIVPAQITTIEDKIIGNFNVTQIFLFLIAVTTSLGIYVIVPISFQVSHVKGVLILCAATTNLFLALRIQRRLVVTWINIFVKYLLRPSRYVWSKHDVYLRSLLSEKERKPGMNLSFTQKKALPLGKHSEQSTVVPSRYRPDRLAIFQFSHNGKVSVHYE